MRFTSLSALKNTLFITAVALVSLIPAANAVVSVVFENPKRGCVYNAGDTIHVKWKVLLGPEDDIAGLTTNLHLSNTVLGVFQGAAPVPSFMGGKGNVFIPTDSNSSDQYIIQAITPSGVYGSNAFTIHSSDTI